MATIRIKREEALNLLREAEETIRGSMNETHSIAFGEALFEKMENSAPFIERTAAWHKAVAEGLAEGSITLTKTGALKGAPAKPKTDGQEIIANFGEDYEGRGAYGRRNLRDVPWEYHDCKTAADVREVINEQTKNRESRLRPITSQITLFSLSDDEYIEVDQGNFHGLLSGRWGHY